MPVCSCRCEPIDFQMHFGAEQSHKTRLYLETMAARAACSTASRMHVLLFFGISVWLRRLLLRYAHPRLIAWLLWPIRRSQRGWCLCSRRGLRSLSITCGVGGERETRKGFKERLLPGGCLVKVPSRSGNRVNKAPFGISNSGPKVTAVLLCNAGYHLLGRRRSSSSYLFFTPPPSPHAPFPGRLGESTDWIRI